MNKKILTGIIVVAVLLGSSVPALAQTHFSLSKTKSSISVSSGEDYTVYIGAGYLREEGNFGFGIFGLGWVITVWNTCDTNISGFMYYETTKLNGEVICDEIDPFSLYPGTGYSFSGWTFDTHPINYIDLSVEIGNNTYSRSGYEIGPFVLLVDRNPAQEPYDIGV